MKALLISAISLFCVATIFRLIHFPGGGMLTLFSAFLIFLFATLNSVVKKKVGKMNVIAGWALFLWSTFLVYKLLFWPGALFLAIPAVILTAVYFVQTLKGEEKKLSPLLNVIVIIGTGLMIVSDSTLYYFFNLNDVFNKEIKQKSHQTWDTYSWLLYKDGKKNEAKVANAKALEVLETTYAKEGKIMEGTFDLYKPSERMYEIEHDALDRNREAIRNDNWKAYF